MVDTAVADLKEHNHTPSCTHARHSGDAQVSGHVSATVRQHLLITEPMSEPSDVLESSESNLAGQSSCPTYSHMTGPRCNASQRRSH